MNLYLRIPSLLKHDLRIPSLMKLYLRIPSLVKHYLMIPSLMKRYLRIPSLLKHYLRIHSLMKLYLGIPSLLKHDLRIPSLMKLYLGRTDQRKMQWVSASCSRSVEELRVFCEVFLLSSVLFCLLISFFRQRESVSQSATWLSDLTPDAAVHC
jgi:hypothetical protein